MAVAACEKGDESRRFDLRDRALDLAHVFTSIGSISGRAGRQMRKQDLEEVSWQKPPST
jgi:hypothetical protein